MSHARHFCKTCRVNYYPLADGWPHCPKCGTAHKPWWLKWALPLSALGLLVVFVLVALWGAR